MYIFQSHNANLDVQLPSKKVVTFKGYQFSTDKKAIGEELNSLCGRHFWRVDNIKVVIEPVIGEVVVEPSPKRRGRPPKIVQGMRMVEDKGEEQ
jgi:hypothetical protein